MLKYRNAAFGVNQRADVLLHRCTPLLNHHHIGCVAIVAFVPRLIFTMPRTPLLSSTHRSVVWVAALELNHAPPSERAASGAENTLTSGCLFALFPLGPFPLRLFAAGRPFGCNPRLGAAGATRSQGLPRERPAENIKTSRDAGPSRQYGEHCRIG